MHPDWVRGLRDQVHAAGAKLFVNEPSRLLSRRAGMALAAPKLPIMIVPTDGRIGRRSVIRIWRAVVQVSMNASSVRAIT
jgi:hypothetical protein